MPTYTIFFAARQPNPGNDSQPKSGLRKISRNLILDFAAFAWTGHWQARLAGTPEGATADSAAAARRGDHDQARSKQALAASYQVLQQAYRQREAIFAAVMADRAEWEQATSAQRHLAVAAHAELRRRHPGQHFPPLRLAEPEPVTQAQRDELTPAVARAGLSPR